VLQASRVDDPIGELRDLLATGRYRDVIARYQSRPSAQAQSPELELLTATAATRLGELQQAIPLGREALEGFRLRGDADGQMRATNLLGAIEFERGRLDQADRLFAEALRLAQQLDDSLLAARASNNLASVAQLRGRPDQSLALYRGALLAYQRLGDRRGMAETYHNLGLSLRQVTLWREAEAAATQAVRLAELEADGSLLALTLTGRVELNLEREELDLASQEIERAIRAAEEAGDELGTAEARRLRARIALRRRDYAAAYFEAEASRSLAARHASALLEAECAAASALALRGLGRVEEANESRAEAVSRFESLGAAAWLERFDSEWVEEA